jgi:hypothetical protein
MFFEGDGAVRVDDELNRPFQIAPEFAEGAALGIDAGNFLDRADVPPAFFSIMAVNLRSIVFIAMILAYP